MNGTMIRALVVKDFLLFFRNRFFGPVTLLALVAYVAIYFLLPRTVDETLDLAILAPALPAAVSEAQEAGLSLTRFESEESLRAAVEGREFPAGILLPGAGGNPRITIFFAADTPPELQEGVTLLVQELSFLQSGQPLPVEVTTEVLGPDLAGDQIPPRDRIVPLLAVFVLLTETLGLASLLSEEIEGRTIRALLVTPLTIGGLFTAKTITGVLLAFTQSFLLLLLVGGLSRSPLQIVVALLLGALLFTAVGFLLGALGRDFMSVMAWGIPVIIVLAVPAIGFMLPGTLSRWVRVIPSYYLVDVLHRAINFGAGWQALSANLMILALFDVVLFALGIEVLRRKLT